MDKDNHKCHDTKAPSTELVKPCPFCPGNWMYLRDYEIDDGIARMIEWGIQHRKLL